VTEQEEKNGPTVTFKCPGCPCIFLTKHDLNKHQNTLGHGNHQLEFKTMHKKIEHDEDEQTWYPSKYDKNESCMLQDKDPKLTQRLRQIGTATMAGYTYKLNGKWIIKKRIGA
jgi:uncharacterized C2H2 Zn-finger protein